MNGLQAFLRLSGSERRLLVRSALLLAAIRLGLWVLPFQTLLRVLGAVSNARVGSEHSVREDSGGKDSVSGDPVSEDLMGGHFASGDSVARVGWAVTRASRWVPSATCLVQALAGQVLLRRRGHLASVRIGVARGERVGGQRRRGETTPVRAHAWLESGDIVVVGGDHARYMRLPRVTGDRPMMDLL
jgi:Transglutaminase-like superfamily